jgi:hypothetical protein
MNKPEWKFLLNGNEINLDLFNYNEIALKISRNKEYWGYTREASLESLEFIKRDAEIMKRLFNNEGVQIDATFEIQRLNEESGLYEVWQSGVIDIMEYKEVYNSNNNLEKVEVNIVDSSIQQKLKTRQNNNVVIGKDTSIEGVALSGLSPIQVAYLPRPLLLESSYKLTEDITERENMAFFYQFGISAFTFPVSIVPILLGEVSNTPFANPFVLSNSSVGVATSILSSIGFNQILLEENSKEMDAEVTASVDFVIYGFVDSGTISEYVQHEFKIVLGEYSYDGVTATLESEITIDTYSVNTYADGSGLGAYYQEQLNMGGTATFTKKPNRVYVPYVKYERFNFGVTAPLSWLIFADQPPVTGNYKFDIDITLKDEVTVSSHKSFLIFETFNSVLEQITDTPNVLYSELLGRTDIGYPDNGDASQIAITSGLFLRNAINMDGSDVVMEANFKDLYDTLNAIYGVAMWYEDGKIRIEKRNEAFGTNIVEIEPTNIDRSIFADLIYSKILIGNQNIKYENVNGQNEHNTILEYSTPLKIKENTLNLVTKDQTDYLGVELARRLSISTDVNVDTKYDDKRFWVNVKETFLQYVSVLGFDGFSSIDGIILPDYAGNLRFSPKRMMQNNADIITCGFFKNNGLYINFEKCGTLARLESTETSMSPLVECQDENISQNFADFNPMLWNMDIGEKDIWQVMKNQNNLFKFELNCGSVYGYLWDLTLKGNKGTLKLIEANYPKE